MNTSPRMARRLAKSVFRAALVACTVLTAPAVSAAFPDRPVHMIVGFPAGGGTDIVARIFADQLSKLWNQPVVVENRGGAGGVIATESVARATPDGYTIFMATLGNVAINQHLYPMKIDPITALTPVSPAVGVHFVLVANPSVPAKNVKDFIALAKKKPGEINYSSSGVGGAPHLAGALFNEMAGVQLTHVPYKGSGPSFTDLLGGQVSVTFDSLVQALPYIEAGKLRALAVLSGHRSPLLPDVPTMAEAGLKGYDFTNWFGIVAPAGTPADIVEKINADVGTVQADSSVQERLKSMGADVWVASPQAFGKAIKEDSDKWGRIIAETGIKPD